MLISSVNMFTEVLTALCSNFPHINDIFIYLSDVLVFGFIESSGKTLLVKDV
jgi:hypothetical protein